MATQPHELGDRVKAICNDLYRSGNRVSVRLVLAQLPDVSSTSTVHKYYAEWKRELDANQQSLYDRLGFSPEFSQAFMKEITRFSVEAESRYKEMAADSDEQRAVVIEDLARADERLYKQTAVVEQLEKNLATAKTEAAEAAKGHSATLAELRQQIAELREENKTLSTTNEGLRTEVAKAQLLLESNQQYVDEVRHNHQAVVDENKQLTTRLADTAKQLARQEAENTGHQQQLQHYKETEAALRAGLEKREAEVTALHSDIRLVRQELDTAQRAATEATLKVTQLQQAQVDLQRTLAEQASVIKTFTGKTGKN